MKWQIKLTWGRLALALLAAGLIAWLSVAVGSRQIITLSDGHQYRFAGASWGTNHIPPGLLPHLYNRLPNSWQNYLQAKLGPRRWFMPPLNTPEELVIWLEPTGPTANVPFVAGGSFAPASSASIGIQGVLVDRNGASESTSSYGDFFAPPRGASVFNNVPGPPGYVYLWFPVVPRRSRVLECKLQEYSGPGVPGPLILPDMGHVKFRNPLYGHYPQWKPEPLPSLKSAGADLSVRLDSFSNPPIETNNANYPQFAKYLFSLAIEPTHSNDEKWVVTQAELADATGNHMDYDIRYPQSTDLCEIYAGLFPAEAAVRLKLTLKRTSGFSSNELLTFTNLPVLPLRGSYSPPNGTSLTNFLDGIPVVIRNIRTDTWSQRRAAVFDPYVVELEMPTHPPGLIGDIVEVTGDTGVVLTKPDSVGPFRQTAIEYNQMLHPNDPPAPKFLTVTVAVQKSRTVEFLVKP